MPRLVLTTAHNGEDAADDHYPVEDVSELVGGRGTAPELELCFPRRYVRYFRHNRERARLETVE
jgi:hypothetical protein